MPVVTRGQRQAERRIKHILHAVPKIENDDATLWFHAGFMDPHKKTYHGQRYKDMMKNFKEYHPIKWRESERAWFERITGEKIPSRPIIKQCDVWKKWFLKEGYREYAHLDVLLDEVQPDHWVIFPKATPLRDLLAHERFHVVANKWGRRIRIPGPLRCRCVPCIKNLKLKGYFVCYPEHFELEYGTVSEEGDSEGEVDDTDYDSW